MVNKENLKAEMIYVDILNEMESIGNDALNVVQALNRVVWSLFVKVLTLHIQLAFLTSCDGIF